MRYPDIDDRDDKFSKKIVLALRNRTYVNIPFSEEDVYERCKQEFFDTANSEGIHGYPYSDGTKTFAIDPRDIQHIDW
jgi:hypothetical protein